MATIIKMKFERGVFVPLAPVSLLEAGDILEFQLPDENIVYLCESDRLAAVESGHVVWTHAQSEGAELSNDISHS